MNERDAMAFLAVSGQWCCQRLLLPSGLAQGLSDEALHPTASSTAHRPLFYRPQNTNSDS